MAAIPLSPSLADIRALQATNLDKLRGSLQQVNVKDLVPNLVARNVLKTYEMGAVYGKESSEAQIDALIELLKTKNHWMGPLCDALIRSGRAPVAQILLQMHKESA